MKKIIYTFLLLISLLCLSSCFLLDFNDKVYSDPETQAAYEEYKELKIQKEELERELESITNEYDSYKDLYDKLNNNITDISDEIDENFAFFNYLEDTIIKSNVTVYHEISAMKAESGSGFVIKEDNSSYYILTNNHVIYDSNSNHPTYVYDYMSNKYLATILKANANYDMAILRIEKQGVVLPVMKLAEENPKEKETVIAIGQPKMKYNNISFGEVVKYGKVSNNDDDPSSRVTYQVVFSTAVIDSGSSGGMLINSNYEVVGINTWKSVGDYYAISSPVLKIKEFLTLSKFSL